jgi:hypothetical protein
VLGLFLLFFCLFFWRLDGTDGKAMVGLFQGCGSRIVVSFGALGLILCTAMEPSKGPEWGFEA